MNFLKINHKSHLNRESFRDDSIFFLNFLLVTILNSCTRFNCRWADNGRQAWMKEVFDNHCDVISHLLNSQFVIILNVIKVNCLIVCVAHFAAYVISSLRLNNLHK